MKYKCKDCGKIYDERPNYCDCGNDSFLRMRTKAERDAEEAEKSENENTEQAEKTNWIGIIFVILLIVPIVMFIRSKMKAVENAPVFADEYLTGVREQMMKDFDPEGITRSGYCIISFEINEDGFINKRQFIKKSTEPEINTKVFHMLKAATIVEKPPATYRNIPIRIEFGCIADEKEASCYSKNIIKDEDFR